MVYMPWMKITMDKRPRKGPHNTVRPLASVMTRRTTISILFATLLLGGCQLLGSDEPSTVAVVVPDGFPPLPVPDYNPLEPAKVALGERLFFDPILSGDQTVSCASCHNPDLAFSDGKPRSIGIDGRVGLRNSPSLINVAYQRLLFWDGGSFTLEAQVLAPLENKDEMNAELEPVLQRLRTDTTYIRLFDRAFGEAPSIRSLTQAVAAYQRTLVSTGSRYDQYVAGQTDALTTQERAGLDLFNGKAGCVTCHAGPLFTNFSFENKGLSMALADSGRARITGLSSDFGKFKVPSLRNVALTAPYMHDGRFSTLETVLQHHNQGGSHTRNQSPMIKAINLTPEETSAIVAFLHSLTDE